MPVCGTAAEGRVTIRRSVSARPAMGVKIDGRHRSSAGTTFYRPTMVLIGIVLNARCRGLSMATGSHQPGLPLRHRRPGVCRCRRTWDDPPGLETAFRRRQDHRLTVASVSQTRCDPAAAPAAIEGKFKVGARRDHTQSLLHEAHFDE